MIQKEIDCLNKMSLQTPSPPECLNLAARLSCFASCSKAMMVVDETRCLSERAKNGDGLRGNVLPLPGSSWFLFFVGRHRSSREKLMQKLSIIRGSMVLHIFALGSAGAVRKSIRFAGRNWIFPVSSSVGFKINFKPEPNRLTRPPPTRWQGESNWAEMTGCNCQKAGGRTTWPNILPAVATAAACRSIPARRLLAGIFPITSLCTILP